MYPNINPDPITVDATANWYVRVAVERGFESIKDTIKNCTRLAEQAEASEEMPKWAADQMRNIVAHNEQLLREMKQYIPEELLPRE